MTVPSSVQVRLKIVIFKETKRTQRPGQTQSPGTDGGGAGMSGEGGLRAPLPAKPHSPITPSFKPRQNLLPP